MHQQQRFPRAPGDEKHRTRLVRVARSFVFSNLESIWARTLATYERVRVRLATRQRGQFEADEDDDDDDDDGDDDDDDG